MDGGSMAAGVGGGVGAKLLILQGLRKIAELGNFPIDFGFYYR